MKRLIMTTKTVQWNTYEFDITVQFMDQLRKEVDELFKLSEGEVIITEDDVINIWNGTFDEAEDHPFNISRPICCGCEADIYSYIKEVLEDEMYDQDYFTNDSETLEVDHEVIYDGYSDNTKEYDAEGNLICQ